jgi:hypothetical protein
VKGPRDGATLLHYVVRARKAKAAAVRLVFERWPEAAAVRDRRGDTPLHAAVLDAGTRLEPELLARLIAAHPKAAGVPGADRQRLPLSVAIATGKAWAVVATDEVLRVAARKMLDAYNNTLGDEPKGEMRVQLRCERKAAQGRSRHLYQPKL